MVTRWQSFQRPLSCLVVGASGGVGLAMVERLLDDPLTEVVFAAARTVHRSQRLVTLQEAEPERLVLVSMDITDEASIERGLVDIKQRTDRLDLVLNTVGVLHEEGISFGPEKRLKDVNIQHLLRSFEVNVSGHLLLIKHVHRMLPREGKSVLASLSARVGSIGDNRLGGWYGYRASKAALNQVMRTVSIEVARTRSEAICVVLHPGTVDTQLSRPFQGNVPEGKLFGAEQSAGYLLDVVDGLDASDTGMFFDWAGEVVEW